MDKTYCILRMSDCEAHFGGLDGEKYTAAWSEIKNSRYMTRKPIIDVLEEKYQKLSRKRLHLKDDRTFWQKLCGKKTETSKKLDSVNNEICCVLDDIFSLKEDAALSRQELFSSIMTFFEAEGFTTLDRGKQTQLWTKGE